MVTKNELLALAKKPPEKPLKVMAKAGVPGFYAYVSPTGGVTWRWDFVAPNGKRKTLSMGRWPPLSIEAAVAKQEEAERRLLDGEDPCLLKRAAKIEAAREQRQKPTFEQVAREWHSKQQHLWTDAYARQVMMRLKTDVFPTLGNRRFAEIEREDIIKLLARIDDERGIAETVRRLAQYIRQIFLYAGAVDKSIEDPHAFVQARLRTPPKPVHHLMVKPEQLGELALKISEYDKEGGEPETRVALQLTLLTAARAGEIVGAEWSEIQERKLLLKNGETARVMCWTVPRERMKPDVEHIVPLSRQALAVLSELRERTGEGRYLFPAPFGRRGHITANGLIFALYRAGYKGRQTVHGFRRLFSTWSNERPALYTADTIEIALSHTEPNRIRGSYNAALLLEERRTLLQDWADHLDLERSKARGKRLLG